MQITIFSKLRFSQLLLTFCGLMLMVLAACHSQDGRTQGDDSQQIAKHQAALPKAGERQCYSLMEGGDTIVISIKWLDDSKFTGSMRYQLREKDRNIGTLEGTRKDSILLADYQFNSEGMTGKRAVAFKDMAGFLVEGYGEITQDSSGFHFTDPTDLQYDLHRKIHKVNCL